MASFLKIAIAIPYFTLVIARIVRMYVVIKFCVEAIIIILKVRIFAYLMSCGTSLSTSRVLSFSLFLGNRAVYEDTFSHPKYHSCMHFNL